MRAQARSRRAGHDAAANRWVLFLGLVTAALVVFAFAGPWPTARHPVARRPALSATQARASNAAVPIERAWQGRASPYRFSGGPAARAQAVDCLAAAALYEAGNDARGQKAVIQVVLNRARTPGFPKTICGVVYQGYDRVTGCQFSFTCDGSFRRRPEHLGWRGARLAARQALAGAVDARVGRATHYHADWLVPYWRDSMAKVARVGSHLFYVPRSTRPRVAAAE